MLVFVNMSSFRLELHFGYHLYRKHAGFIVGTV
jgi:hypothetical protein